MVTGVITLTSGELYIGRNLTITGPGASELAISGNHASRVFETAPGATGRLLASGLHAPRGLQDSTSGLVCGVLFRARLQAVVIVVCLSRQQMISL